MARFVVTEATGRRGITYGVEGLSCHVIDTSWNRRIIASFRSEDIHGSRLRKWEAVRRLAADRAAELNLSVAA